MTAPAVDRRASRRAGAAGHAGPPGRLPAPVKERRPALAALAVLLVVGGALASGLLVLQSGERDSYLVVVRTVNPGQQITGDDLGTAEIAGTGANAVAAANRPDVVGDYATTRIFPGTLITDAMTAEEWEIPDGQTIVGAVLSTSQRPATRLSPGDLVAVLAVPRTDGTGAQTSTVLLNSAEVVAVEDTSTNGAIAVSLLVPLRDVPAVTAAAAQGTVAVAQLPGLAVPESESATGPDAADPPVVPSSTAPQAAPPATPPVQVPPQDDVPEQDGELPAPDPAADGNTAGTP